MYTVIWHNAGREVRTTVEAGSRAEAEAVFTANRPNVPAYIVNEPLDCRTMRQRILDARARRGGK